jgi:hypothetical protein
MSNQLPDVNTAYNTVFQNAHSNVFFSQLQASGIVPQNEKEANDLLLLGAELHATQQQEKAASSRFDAPLNNLRSVVGSAAQAPFNQLAIKQAAATLMADPDTYNSVLALAAYELSANQ